MDYSLVGGAVGKSSKSGAYNINLQFKHNLQESSGQSDAAWGFFLKAAIADGNPNYVNSSLIAVTPWLSVGPDIQYIKPASSNFDNALVAGLRLQLKL